MDPETKEATPAVPSEESKKQEENTIPIGEAVEQIYNEIEEQGKKITSSLSSYWNSFQAHVLPSNESTSNLFETLGKKTEAYINELDEDLITIQNTTTSYLKKFGSFWDQSKSEPEREPVESSKHSNAQLNTLNTSRELYLIDSSTDKQFLKFRESFNFNDLDVQNTRNLYLQEGGQPLVGLIKELVPEKMSEEDFWAKYIYMRQKISKQNEKQDEKSSTTPPKKEESDDFKWDDSDEESEFAIVQKPTVELTAEGEVLRKEETGDDSEKKDVANEPSKPIQEPKSATETVPEIAKLTVKEDTEAKKTEAKNDDDDDDDDWE